MEPIVTAFANSPDRGRGLARDMAVRWALEEVGQPHAVQRLTFAELKAPAHLARNPFGQIPTYEQNGLVLFESAAIVLHIAERHGELLPAEPQARARAITWLFAAVATVEPPIVERSMALLLEVDKPWHAERLAMLDARVAARLAQLAHHLGEKTWLDGAFSAADLVMVAVLRRLSGSGLLDAHAPLAAYVARGEQRPAFVRAFAAQQAVAQRNA
ncbi:MULTISPECIES: glutathione S-transferase family protein [unclassified Novosphingobium]|uniref:glutathione S-transferase family protein n=1 Tax=unclassified Novosphingobium TaxID=2644732 RepID=UPI00146BA94B|nr:MULTISPECIES: glutathione S-transferase family protein [unclassified Novosphingobium]NMN06501.1 glutathione S-transferase [Novosphingobium sp. SG919]NMN89051.1 glutathione S-transferase [Novosphingobium sp. SG916]